MRSALLPARNLLGILVLLASLLLPAAAAPPPAPVVTVAPFVTRGVAAKASVPARSGVSYAWSVTAGSASLVSGRATATVTFKAAGTGPLTLQCREANGSGSASGKGTTTVVAYPAASVSAPAAIAPGATGGATETAANPPGFSYAWTVSGGAAVAGASTAGLTFQAGNGGYVTLACRVTNPAGTSVQDSARVFIASPPVATLTAPALVQPKGTYAAYVPLQAHATFAWQVTGASFTRIPGLPNSILFVPQAWSAGGPNVVAIQCVVTNALGASATGTAAPAIQGPPLATVAILAPNPATLTQGAAYAAAVPAQPGATFAWSITGGKLTSDAGANPVSFTADPVTSLTLTCKVTNALHVSASGSVTVSLVPAPGLFSPSQDSLQAPRTGHTQTLLADGRILVAGGLGADNLPLASAEIHDPSGQAAPVSITLTAARAGHTATLLADGTVLLAGGDLAGTSEFIDPAHGTATAGPGLQQARSGHTATLLRDGTILLAGGLGGTPSAAMASMELLNPFAAVPGASSLTMAVARSGHTATLLPDGTVLLAGGVDPSSGLKLQGLAEIYVPGDGTLRKVAMSSARSGAAAVLLDASRVLFLGGSDGTGPLDTVDRFDVASSSFAPLGATLATPRNRPTATLLPDGRILVAGGVDGTGAAIASGECLDPAGASTLLGSGMGAGGGSGHTASLLRDGQVFCAGGSLGAGILRFDPQDPTPQLPPLPDATLAGMPASLNPPATWTVTLPGAHPAPGAETCQWRAVNADASEAADGRSLACAFPPAAGSAGHAVTVDVLVTSALGIPVHARASVPIPPLVPVIQVQDAGVGDPFSSGDPFNDGTVVTAQVANVPKDGTTFTWPLNGASFTGTSFTFTAHNASSSKVAWTLQCAASSGGTATFVLNVLPSPATLQSFTGPGSVSQNTNFTLTWSGTHATDYLLRVIDHSHGSSIQDLGTATSLVVGGIAEETKYEIVPLNDAGPGQNLTWTVSVVGHPGAVNLANFAATPVDAGHFNLRADITDRLTGEASAGTVDPGGLPLPDNFLQTVGPLSGTTGYTLTGPGATPLFAIAEVKAPGGACAQ